MFVVVILGKVYFSAVNTMTLNISLAGAPQKVITDIISDIIHILPKMTVLKNKKLI